MCTEGREGSKGGLKKDTSCCMLTSNIPIGEGSSALFVGGRILVTGMNYILFTLLPFTWFIRSLLSSLTSQKDKHARLSLGPRTFLELSDFVRAHEMEMPQILYF